MRVAAELEKYDGSRKALSKIARAMQHKRQINRRHFPICAERYQALHRFYAHVLRVIMGLSPASARRYAFHIGGVQARYPSGHEQAPEGEMPCSKSSIAGRR
jgi:hypothetical protein